jgi:hypothetical protein
MKFIGSAPHEGFSAAELRPRPNHAKIHALADASCPQAQRFAGAEAGTFQNAARAHSPTASAFDWLGAAYGAVQADPQRHGWRLFSE